jgi:hypothetical protein
MENRLSESKSFFAYLLLYRLHGCYARKISGNCRKNPKKAKHPRPTGDSRKKRNFPCNSRELHLYRNSTAACDDAGGCIFSERILITQESS